MRRRVSGAAASAAVPPSVELWRDIPGFEGAYQASSLGRIRSLPRVVPVFDSLRRVVHARACPGRILSPASQDKTGHLCVRLGKHTRSFPVHQLVLLAFRGLPPAGMESLHINGNPTDNRLENLRYGTHSENMIDMYRHGRGRGSFTPEQVRQIRRALKSGVPICTLAAYYGVSTDCIWDIRKGRRYKWVA